MFYFAYGSNMSLRRLASRTPSASFHSVATLSGYRLKFHKASLDGSAKCDVVPCPQQESKVHGVIYHISHRDKAALDKFEGLGQGYDEDVIPVLDRDNQALDVNLYLAIQTNPSLKPYHWYKQHVLIGARENDLPADYIRHIEQTESIADDNSARHRKELSIYR